MLKRTLKLLLPLIGFVFGCQVGTQNVWAQDAGYEVKAIPSTKQVDTTKTYFDLRLEPKESHTVNVRVTNQSDQERIVNTQVKTATTNTNGVIEYIKSEQNKSINLPYDMSKLVKTNTPEITLAPHESKEVVYEIKMPEKDFSGVLSGGIIFTSEENEKTEKSTADVAINNQFGYVIALVLHGNKPVDPDLELSTVSLGQVNNRNVVFANLANPESAYLNRLNLHATIKQKNKDKILYETKKNEQQMAPNSLFNYPISLQETEFKPGKYLLTIHAESKGKTWDFEKEFEIKGEEAKKLNDKAYIHKEKNNYWLYIILLLILLLLIILVIVYRKRQQKIKALEEQVEELKKNN
ncbi:DUF916 and DUF3324 domain-containing protein [Candidatus Enterococcus mansonii]|uniref:Uncharacterized protein n=1 Tax=Candidatus Enterococcus mansonii TaxID=1834181 RepID=A0A242CC97_9ENTE|nr:DUF916 and DUF3324 domain-containing protein [Enterococcus sp. 4G2_DIV0659]OTO07816.1 hypothetical protein A5880_002086 [Enterococcus sp. 4G2_DIV0659]